MALYLLEPKTCKYILTIESPSLCELLNGPMDEYGLFIKKSNTNDEKIDSEIKTKSEDNLAISPEDFIDKSVLSVQMEEETEENDENKKLFIIEL